jgi:hypothetical protein
LSDDKKARPAKGRAFFIWIHLLQGLNWGHEERTLDLSEHVLVSAGGAGALALAGEWQGAALFFGCGVLIDLDHLNDYWRETGFNSDWRRFLGYFDGRHPRHLVLLFHGWEWAALALFLGWRFDAAAWVWAGAGWLTHLLLDQRFNRLHPFAYSFLFRASKRFRAGYFYLDDAD